MTLPALPIPAGVPPTDAGFLLLHLPAARHAGWLRSRRIRTASAPFHRRFNPQPR